MPALHIRNVDDVTHSRLAARAKAHGWSLQEEARNILKAAAQQPDDAPHPVHVANLLFRGERAIEIEIPKLLGDVRDVEFE